MVTHMELKSDNEYRFQIIIGGYELPFIPYSYYNKIRVGFHNCKYYSFKNKDLVEDTNKILNYSSIHYPLISLKDKNKYRIDLIAYVDRIEILAYCNNTLEGMESVLLENIDGVME